MTESLLPDARGGCRADLVTPPERVLLAIGRLQEETARTWVEPLVTELVEALAADTTAVELRQEIEFLKAEAAQC